MDFGRSAFSGDLSSSFGLLDGRTYHGDPASFGLHAGYGRVFGAVYLGVEAQGQYHDTAFGDYSGYSVGSGIGSPGGPSTSSYRIYREAFVARTRFSGSANARIGFEAGAFMPYVIAGIAAAHTEIQHLDYTYVERTSGGTTVSAVSGDLTTSKGFDFGYRVGGGVATMIAPKVSVRAEYSFSDYPERTVRKQYSGETIALDLDKHDLRIGLSYHF